MPNKKDEIQTKVGDYAKVAFGWRPYLRPGVLSHFSQRLAETVAKIPSVILKNISKIKTIHKNVCSQICLQIAKSHLDK